MDTVIIATTRTGGASSDSGTRDGCGTSNQVRARSVPLRGSQHDSGRRPESNQCSDAEIVFTGPCERGGEDGWPRCSLERRLAGGGSYGGAGAAAMQLPGVTKMTVGLSMRDGLTMEAWLDTPNAFAAKTLTARLQKNPKEAPLFGQMGGAMVEQRDNAVRLYVRVTDNQLTGSSAPQGAPARAPALGLVASSKVAEVQRGHGSRRG